MSEQNGKRVDYSLELMFLVIGILIFMFAGKPDLHDALIQYLLSNSEPQEVSDD